MIISGWKQELSQRAPPWMQAVDIAAVLDSPPMLILPKKNSNDEAFLEIYGTESRYLSPSQSGSKNSRTRL